jgi:hypothetical protein
MMLVMARSEEYLQQLVASEAIIAAASKKKDASVIVSQGLDILKSLYKSKNDHIKGTVQHSCETLRLFLDRFAKHLKHCFGSRSGLDPVSNGLVDTGSGLGVRTWTQVDQNCPQ